MKWAACLAALALWACSAPTLTPTLPPSPTRAATPRPATFPPTWTPTFTRTALPPSATNTPPPSPSPSPTLGASNLADVCADFQFVNQLRRGQTFLPGNQIAFGVETERADVVVRFLAVHRLTGDNQGLQIPGGQFVLAELPVSKLPRSGLYDWTISLHHDEAGDFCEQGGYFFVLAAPVPAEPEATETVEPAGDSP